MGFTVEQERAIRTDGCELLISAAAGSGKTAVLVERIIYTITKKPVDIDRLLVVTFTEAAADEMRQRISSALTELQQQNPKDENLQKQLMLLPRAHISTIHKFCAGLVRRYFHLTDIDPGFKIADETEAGLLKSQVLDELFEQHYSEGGEFFELVDYYGGGRTKDAGLHELVLEINEFISGFPWPEEWLKNAAEMYNITSLEDTAWAGVLREELSRRLDGIAATVRYATELAADGAAKYLDALHGDKFIVEDLRSWLGVSLKSFRESLYDVKHETLARLGAKDEFDPDIKQRIQDIRNKEIKAAIKELQQIFPKTISELESDVIQLLPVQRALCELAAEFSKRYGEEKRRRNIADFSDLEQYALKVLFQSSALSEAALELRERFHEVMIDEYQDSNSVQELILSAVANNNRFMVGDIKQSIYKFRGAKPGIFTEKYKSFHGGQAGVRIDLSRNFRSRECVVNAVNAFFYRLMTDEVEYDDDAALYYGAEYPDAGELNISQQAELYLVDDGEDGDISKIQLEAMIVAERIHELVRGGNPLYVYDRDAGYRRAEFRDIVIILRSMRGGVAETFLETLKKSGIPAFANSTGGYFESVEVMTVLSFLQIIDNPKQDIQLLAVLRSPIYGLTDDELLRIRGVLPGAPLYDCVSEYAKKGDEASKKLERFLCELERFRDEAVYLSISAIIDSVYAATDYFNYAGAMAGGAVRQANLRLLREKAVQYEETSYKGLFHFIGYMQKIKDKSDEGDAKALSENANLVRLMTIHKSKGLEFPIVFVSLLGRKFSRADERKSVLLHEELGLGSVHMDLERRIRSNTLPRAAITKKLRQESLSEELRVLYVAMTRAREKLILTGSVSRPDEYEKWGRYKDGLPAHAIFGASCYLDWIAPVVHHSDVAVYHKTIFDVADAGISEEERDEQRHDALDGLEASVAPIVWDYPLKAIAALPAKLSISEIKRLNNRGVDADAVAYRQPAPVYEKPAFLRGDSGLGSVGKGTIMHTVLEHMDMSRPNELKDIEELVSRLTAKSILSPREAAAVDYKALCKFNQSQIMRRIVAAYPNVYRETPFVMGLTPYQIYKRPELKDSGASILVHGIIDCYFEENGRLVLLDYKTDYVKSLDELLDSYSLQMAVYKSALERATGKQVSECLLYLFGMSAEVNARLADLQ